jgi:DNA-3-methyladenine glycosylase I
MEKGPLNLKRCAWPLSSNLMVAYHDEEWGMPVHDDRKLFEFMVLDAFQAGLSWSTILNKRENFRRALDNFEPAKVARYNKRKVERLLTDAGIVRNRLKVEATITNARSFLESSMARQDRIAGDPSSNFRPRPSSRTQ